MKWLFILAILFGFTWLGWQIHWIIGVPMLVVFLAVMSWFSPIGRLED